MNETSQQYTERIIRTLGDRKPLEVLDSTPDRVAALVQAIEEKHTGSVAPSGKWTAREIVAHFSEGEIVIGYRIRRILTTNGGPIEAYDQNEWVKNSKYLQSDLSLALSFFKTIRKVNLAFLKSLTPEQWEYYGIHSERGKESIARMAELYAGHDLNHLRQLEQLADKAS